MTWPRESGHVAAVELDCRDEEIGLFEAGEDIRRRPHPHNRERDSCAIGCMQDCRISQPSEEIQLQVLVRDNNIDQALRVLKKKMQREGVFREMKQRRSYEKPSERKTREKSEAIRRARKLARKQAIREGLLPAPPKKKLPERKPPLPAITSKERA